MAIYRSRKTGRFVTKRRWKRSHGRDGVNVRSKKPSAREKFFREEKELRRLEEFSKRQEKRFGGQKKVAEEIFRKWAAQGTLLENLELRKMFITRDRFRDLWIVSIEARGFNVKTRTWGAYLISFAVNPVSRKVTRDSKPEEEKRNIRVKAGKK